MVRLEAVSRRFPGPPPVDALRASDLEVGAGEFLAVMGPSGSGKSTLLNLLGLIDRPTTGSYELAGSEVTTLTDAQRSDVRANRVGFVFQAFHLLAYRSATENVELGMLYRCRNRSARRSRAVAALERVGLSQRRDAFPDTMSGGERQRVAIARAIASGHELLLCDEPTGNLDSRATNGVLRLLAELHADGLTVVVITHDPAVASGADRVVEIYDGQLRRSV